MTQPTQDYGSVFSAVQDVNAEAAEAVAELVTEGVGAFAGRYALTAILPVAQVINTDQALAVLGLAAGADGESAAVTVHASTEGLRVYRDEDGLVEAGWLHSDGQIRAYPEADR